MNNTSLIFRLPDQLGYIELTDNVLAHFKLHKQQKYTSLEAGGQLFAMSSSYDPIVKVVNVTGPRLSDKRTVLSYVPDYNAERAEITEFYKKGLHFIGDWHTHHQPIPSPSQIDNESMSDLVNQSSHGLPGFIMVIIGQEEFPNGIYVSFHSKTFSEPLFPTIYTKTSKNSR